MEKIIIAYVPVLHEGYRKLFEKYSDAKLYILGSEIISEFTHLSKEIRQLDPELIKKSIESWDIVSGVEVLNIQNLTEISKKNTSIVMPDEDIMHDLVEKYFSGKEIIFDSIFLRWDKHKSMEEKPVEADQTISRESFDKEVIQKLKVEAERSSDIWRRIGAAIVKDGKIIFMTHNIHVPSPHSPFAEGDPRNNFHKGLGIEYSTVLHAEAGLIAEAAKKGISLEGTSLYVSTFPCPPCAKQVAFSGIKKLYYTGGYSILDQERILRSQGVEIIFVEP
ncbi:MAG: deaminase [Patescibacteria group bacterium]